MRDATEIVVVMDRSGSMGPLRSDVIGGFNNFVKEQQGEKGEANLTLIQFSTVYDVIYIGKPIQEVQPLDNSTYRPGGGTALNDALAKGITETGKRLADMDEKDRPDKVICVVITDGEENSSREHTKSQVAEMVNHQQEKYDWAFIYLGANVDAFDEAAQLKISNAANFSPSSKGVMSAYIGTSHAVKRYRRAGKKALTESDNWKSKIQ